MFSGAQGPAQPSWSLAWRHVFIWTIRQRFRSTRTFARRCNLSSTAYLAILRACIRKAGAQVASLIGASPSEIIFTASRTEADNLALIGTLTNNESAHVVTSVLEHAAILETCRFLKYRGTEIDDLPVDQNGLLNPDDLRTTLRPDTRLVSVMTASNVIGTVQPINELAQVAKEHGALFHTDAVQACGKIPIDVRATPLDLASLSAHKLHGPKGIGALYVRDGVRLDPIIFGGGQERGLRSATENVAGIVGFGAAAAIAEKEMVPESARLLQLRQQILNHPRFESCQGFLIGHPVKRLPGHLCLGFHGLEQDVLKLSLLLDEQGVAVSYRQCLQFQPFRSHIQHPRGNGVRREPLSRIASSHTRQVHDARKCEWIPGGFASRYRRSAWFKTTHHPLGRPELGIGSGLMG